MGITSSGRVIRLFLARMVYLEVNPFFPILSAVFPILSAVSPHLWLSRPVCSTKLGGVDKWLSTLRVSLVPRAP